MLELGIDSWSSLFSSLWSNLKSIGISVDTSFFTVVLMSSSLRMCIHWKMQHKTESLHPSWQLLLLLISLIPSDHQINSIWYKFGHTLVCRIGHNGLCLNSHHRSSSDLLCKGINYSGTFVLISVTISDIKGCINSKFEVQSLPPLRYPTATGYGRGSQTWSREVISL